MTIKRAIKYVSSVVVGAYLLAGCTVSSVTSLHPPPPDPVEPISLDWKIEVVENKARVYLSWEDAQKFRMWLEDFKRYTRESKVIMCYYRKDLNEERCKEK